MSLSMNQDETPECRGYRRVGLDGEKLSTCKSHRPGISWARHRTVPMNIVRG